MVQLNKDFLHKVMSVQSTSGNQSNMQYFILEEVMRLVKDEGIFIDSDIDNAGNLYFTRGEGKKGYPCVVSHMDTVHDIVPDNQFQIIRHGGTWHAFNPVKYEMTGIGGDDKVGVYLCLEALRQIEDIKVAFFTDEEVGCIGSSKANMAWFDDVNLVLQADRKGNSDFVSEINGTLFGDEFLDAVTPILEQHGYYECKWGGITDVGELKDRGLKVAVANMSAGYYNPHRDNEYIVLKDVENVLQMAFTIIEELGETRWEHESEYNYRYSYTPYNGYGFYGANKDTDTKDDDDKYVDYWQKKYDEAAKQEVPNAAAPTPITSKTSITKSSKSWGTDNYYMNDRFTDYSAAIDDSLELSPAPRRDDCCINCGSMAVIWDSTEDTYFCHDCNDYTALEWGDYDAYEEGIESLLNNDREILIGYNTTSKAPVAKKVRNNRSKKAKNKKEVRVHAF